MTMEQLADDAASLATSLGSGKVVLFGHSYGGFIAQEFALRHPERVQALVLCYTAPGQLGSRESEEASPGPPPPPEFIEMITSAPHSDAEFADGMTKLIPAFLYRQDPAEIERRLSDTVYCASANERGFEILSGWSYVDRLSSIQAPTLVLVGAHNAFTSPSQARRIASRITTAGSVEFANSGHMPWLDEPERFFSQWLATGCANTQTRSREGVNADLLSQLVPY
jgi:proline iminopeptidase